MLLGDDHAVETEVLKAATVCFIDKETVKALLHTNPALGLQFFRRTARELDDAEVRYAESLTLPIEARFAHLLLALRQRYGETAANGSVSMALPLTRRDIASMLGVRPETLSRAIRKLHDDGLATFRNRDVTIPDPATLYASLAAEARI